jgi:hypothetical protein
MKNLPRILLIFILSLFSCHDDDVLPTDMNFKVMEYAGGGKYGPYDLNIKYMSHDSVLLSLVDPQFPIDPVHLKAEVINQNDSTLQLFFAPIGLITGKGYLFKDEIELNFNSIGTGLTYYWNYQGKKN